MHAILMASYSAIYTLALLLYAPAALLRRAVSGRPTSLLGRFGAPPRLSGRPVWVHAVSVGEVNAVRPLVEALLARGLPVALSTTTMTGREVAQSHFPDLPLFYFPPDWKWSCRRALRALGPSLVVLAETELWPNFLAAARSRQVPVGLVNARLSDPSMRGYRRVGWLLRPLLADIEFAFAQSASDAARLEQLGVAADRIQVAGNLKYDVTPPDPAASEALRKRVLAALGRGESPLWLCGSTREGEERQLAEVFARLRQRWPRLRLIVAPRHPHRAAELESLLGGGDWRVARRTQLNGEPVRADVLILDTVGELAGLYPVADVVFVGGSLVAWGGQNIVEPAAAGRAVLFGPHMDNFREISKVFLDSGAVIQVSNPDELREEIDRLLADEPRRLVLGESARRVAAANRGGVERTVRRIEQLVAAGRSA